MSLQLFGYQSLREKIEQEKKWLQNNFADCPYVYDPEASWLNNAVICRLSVLKRYCQSFGLDQLLNKEFNDALAVEIKKLALSPILEVNAGSGDLAKVLGRRGIEVIAVDEGYRPRPPEINQADAWPSTMAHREALHKYKPQLVLCSWMPEDMDMTRAFRETESVLAYILIDEEQKMGSSGYDGWSSQVLKEPNKWSLCHLDHGVDFDRPELYGRHAKVIIYHRL